MTLDQYELCPCGSGKKVKFCCSRDLLHELDRLQQMIQGGQRLAALEKIDTLLEKHADRPSLLTIKTDLQLELGEPAKAFETLAKLKQLQPKNPSAVATQGLMALMAERDLPKAINLLQDAFELVDGTITARMYETVMLLGTALLANKRYLAAKGHLQFALAVTDGKDERCAATLMQLNQDRRVPLLLREPLTLEPCPDNVTWRIEFESALADISRGRWRAGAKTLSAMSNRILDAPSILMNLAIVSGWLNDFSQSAKAFRAYSQIRDVPLERRVHAAALAQELDPQISKASQAMQIAYEVDNLDAILERCVSHKQLLSIPVEGNVTLNEDSPPPRALYRILSKEVSTEAEPSLDQVPEVLGALVFFGKQTDRPAQMIIEAIQARMEPITRICEEFVGASLGTPTSEKVIGATSWPMVQLFGDWHIANTSNYDQHQRLLRDLQRRAVMDRWPNTPAPLLDGKTPKEAAAESKYQIPVLANLLSLSLMCDNMDVPIDPSALRKELNLPALPAPDVQVGSVDKVPTHRFGELDIRSLDDEQLLGVYRRSYALMVVQSLRRAAQEVVERPSLNERIDKVEAYDILSDVAASTDDSLRYLAQARKLATKEGESPAAWLIDEAEIRLVRGEMNEFVDLIKEIQARYMREPGVMQNLVEMLARFGLVTPDGRVLLPSSGTGAGAPGAETGSGLWTPESDAAAPLEPKSESKLWIPGMD